MAERSSVVEVTQIGTETTPGTAVAATVRLASADIKLNLGLETDEYRPSGYKAPTIVSPTKDWTTAEVKGKPTYNELTYLLAMLFPFTNPTVTDGASSPIAAAKAWQFRPSTNALDTLKSMTVENGQALRAHRAAYTQLTELGYTFDRGGNPDLSGAGIARLLQDGITLSAGATELAGGPVPIFSPQVDVFLDTTAAGIGTTQLTRLTKVEWKLGGRQSPLWTLDSAQTSWAALVEKDWDSTMTVMLEADAAGMALLPSMRAGSTLFLRVRGRGPTIAAAPAGGGYKLGGGSLITATNLPNIFQHDFVGKINNPGKFEDSDGTQMISFTLKNTHDSTLGYAQQILLVNTITGTL